MNVSVFHRSKSDLVRSVANLKYDSIRVFVAGKSVFFYDGTVECFHGTHLVLVIVSSIVLLFFVLVPPVAVLLICTGRTNAPLQVADALTKGLR